MPDSSGFLLSNEREVLLRRYAPVLVLFPEKANQAPYPDDGDATYTLRRSYPPRSVDFFLKYARVRYRWQVWLRDLRLFFRPRSAAEERERAHNNLTRDEFLAGIQEFKHDPRYAGLGDAELRAAVMVELVQRRLADRISGFNLPHFRGHNLKHWRSYFKFLDETDPAARRSTVYGRLIQGLAPLGKVMAESDAVHSGPYDVSQTRVALQYWFQYYYDDWANRHEGDWETITILLELNPALLAQIRELSQQELLDGVTVRDVGYAAHEDGYRRLWDDVQKTKEGRPLVYIARGSSASYFAWRIDGYPTSARIGLLEKILSIPGMLLRGRRIFGRRWDVEVRARVQGRDPKNTDWVPVDPFPEDRLDESNTDPLECLVPLPCRGIRRAPDFGVQAGQNDHSYHLETQDTFWLEMVEEYGVMWGENYFLPGTRGPAGLSNKHREQHRNQIRQLLALEKSISQALRTLTQIRFTPNDAIPELGDVLRPLRPVTLRKQHAFPPAVQGYVYTMWTAILDAHPEAWPGGPGLILRFILWREPRLDPLLSRDDPMYHLKSLWAQVRRVRYEVQQEDSKWDNPFAWARYICQPDTFYYGITPSRESRKLDMMHLDCSDVDLSIR